MNTGPARLHGMVVVITGAASGFGLAAARRFVAEGAQVWGLDLATEPATDDPTAAEIRYLQVDVTDEDAVAEAVDQVVSDSGQLDVMVNNAGIVGGGWIDEDGATEELWRNLSINVGGVWNGCRAAVRVMRESGGVILNTASTAALHPTPGAPAYGLAKAAVVHLTRSLAAGYGGNGIRVNAVLPGPAQTGIFGDDDGTRERLEAIYVDKIPLGRLGEVDDVAAAMAFLASPEASFITGTTLTVDGGFRPPSPFPARP